MGFLTSLFGIKAEIGIERPRISDLAIPIEGDDGTPGTKTQIEVIGRLICEPPLGDLTYAQAGAIMSARSYSKFVMDDVLSHPNIRHPRRSAYLALQANLIAFIVRDPKARRKACEWGDRNFDRGEDKPPPKDEHWHQAVAFIAPVLKKLSR